MHWWKKQIGFFGEFYLKADTLRKSKSHKKEINRRTKKEIDGVENYLRDNEVTRILDCPCGYGRHSKKSNEVIVVAKK